MIGWYLILLNTYFQIKKNEMKNNKIIIILLLFINWSFKLDLM